MSDCVLFEMYGTFRQSLIAGHLFYVDQAQKRLFAQFNDIDSEADEIGRNALEKNSKFYNPYIDNGDRLQEDAYEQMCEFHRLLSDMRDRTKLSIVAGMFHEWEKQLHGWLLRQIQHRHHNDTAAKEIRLPKFDRIEKLLKSLGWKITSTDYFRQLDACRLVVNVYKHGEGSAFDKLKLNYPEYLHDPFSSFSGGFAQVECYDHTHLKVSDTQVQAFSDAIVAFWQAAPENIIKLQVEDLPSWLLNVLKKDCAGQPKGKTK